MEMRQTLRLGTFRGIPVGVNWSVIVIFGLLTYELAEIELPSYYNSGPRSTYWVAALVAAALFLFSILAHEVSHAVVARHNGIGVHSITLWLFGGVAQLEGEALTPGADFRIAAVGPGTSIALGGVFGLLAVVGEHAGVHGLPVDVAKWLSYINLLLAAFNLIPAAPLDGGRILRSGLWKRSGDQARASMTASRAGRVFGVLLIAGGILGFVDGQSEGLWLGFMGWFLYSAAGAEEGAAVKGSIAGLTVRDVMSHQPPTLPSSMTVAEVLRGYLPWLQGEAIAISGVTGWLEGVLTLEGLRSVAPSARVSTRIGDVAMPIMKLPVAHPQEQLSDVLRRMQAAGGPAVVLDAEGRLAGLVTPVAIQRAAQRSRMRVRG
jgi:Zn-dependent protease